MSTLIALARALAVRRGRAQPVATVRHLHCSDRPLVVIPLTLAGEANAPLAVMAGDDPDHPRTLVVPQPRNRDQRFAFAAQLASIVLPYVERHRGAVEAVAADRGRQTRWRSVDAPQLLVPNLAGVGFLRLFGRATRFRSTEGPYPVAPEVPLLGRWLTVLAERAEYPGSSMLVAMTEALALHWATGQSAVEDANLAALMAWIAPPEGLDGAKAALDAEDPELWPPAGPATDPGFDNAVLAPAMEAHDAARAGGPDDDPLAEPRAYAAIERALTSQLAPTWGLLWRAVDLLRALPAGPRAADRWAWDR
ncbi:MAG: hypothetical protein KJO75_05930, partial [Dactylosporangium sp.]|nr:hypothetical protein [Dactylosporangium sp.]